MKGDSTRIFEKRFNLRPLVGCDNDYFYKCGQIYGPNTEYFKIYRKVMSEWSTKDPDIDLEKITKLEIYDKICKAQTIQYNKEIKILQLLEENFINEPNIEHYPFPRIVDTTEASDYYSITMSHCGNNARQNAHLVEAHQNIEPINYYNTVQCIINNLRSMRIIHGDIKHTNICINTTGYISLIDFERSQILEPQQAEKYYKEVDMYKEKHVWYLIVSKNPWSMLYMF